MFISPMLLQKNDHPFDDDSYITELKLDGIRIIWTKFNDRVRIYTRHNNECTSMYPELYHIDLPNGTILDGEIVSPDEEGKPNFEYAMERFKSKNSPHLVQYCVFDVIQYNGEKVWPLPLLKRKELLASIIPAGHPNITAVQWIEGNGKAYFDLIVQRSLEGIVLKKKNTHYEIGKRSHSWLKVINYQYEEVYITGIRKNQFGVFLSFLDGITAGVMEFMPPAARKELYAAARTKTENDKAKYIEPIKCLVKYRNLTSNGKLRIPSFVEWV